MSAICGLFHLDRQPVHRDLVAVQMDALAHRGPNGRSSWVEGPVGLGHRELNVTSESRREAQPFVRDAGRLVLVADARIDNRKELASALGMRHAARAGDCEVILAAYERWGVACAAHLIGDFAFAIWDRRTTTVFCARDPMGVKPFYFHHTPRSFAFASEIKGLLCLPGVPRDLDDDAIGQYIACLHDDRERTQFRRIRRLPAASAMTVNASGVDRTVYWRAADAPAVRFASADQYVEAFAAIFADAVRVRLRSDRPVGATLSGGLDSSSVVCTARRLTAEAELSTFSLVFPSLPADELELIDERGYIDNVARMPGLRSHLVRGDLESPLADMSRMLWHLDEPHIAPNLYLHCALYRAAQESGVGVLLDGFDGDATISHGFGRFNNLLASGDLGTFEREARTFAARRGRAPESVLPHFGFPFLASLARSGKVRPWLRTARDLAARFPVSRRELLGTHGLAPAIQRIRGDSGGASVANASTMSVLRAELSRPVARRLREADARTIAMAAAPERVGHLDTIGQPLYQLTLEIADKAAHAYGIEPRYPFFDRRLIEFCVGLPEEQKFTDGWPRHLFRRAMEGILPTDIQWRVTKGNLAPNFDRRFRSADRATVDVACEHPALDRYIERDALRMVARRYFSGTNWGDPDGMLLFRTTMLANWLPTAGHSGPRPDAMAGPEHDLGTPTRFAAAGGVCLTT